MKVSALIPVKDFRNAKQRLSPLLGVAEREHLAEAMFRHVLREVVETGRLNPIYVVTGNDYVATIAASMGAEIIREPDETGETNAVDFARRELQRDGCEAILILPADLPLVRAADIELILEQVPDNATPPFALLVPSHDRMGTNALLLAPPDIIKLRFGYDSFSYHASQVSAQGLALRFTENEHFGLDIDEPADFKKFIAGGSDHNETYRLARQILAESETRARFENL
jgi:2-phospho-L-lactate guanylyltransferase